MSATTGVQIAMALFTGAMSMEAPDRAVSHAATSTTPPTMPMPAAASFARPIRSPAPAASPSSAAAKTAPAGMDAAVSLPPTETRSDVAMTMPATRISERPALQPRPDAWSPADAKTPAAVGLPRRSGRRPGRGHLGAWRRVGCRGDERGFDRLDGNGCSLERCRVEAAGCNAFAHDDREHDVVAHDRQEHARHGLDVGAALGAT